MGNISFNTETSANIGTNRRKVLFIATVYTHLANFHIPFMKLFQEKGYEVHAAASSVDGRREEIESAGVYCHEIEFSRSLLSFANYKAFRQLVMFLKSQRFDLIHVHTPIAAFLGRLAAKLTKQGSVLYTAHGFHFYKGAPSLNWLIYFTAEKIAVKWTDALIVINEEDFANACRLGFKPNKNLFFVNGVGVETQKYKASKNTSLIRKELEIPADAVVVVCVAELTNVKNHVFLLDAWRLLVIEYDNIHLLLVGMGKDEEKLKFRVKDETIPRVHFLGFRSDISNILTDSDIAVLTSRREGLPKSIMEAMAVGKPVVATNVRGNRDLVDNEQTGFIIELGDVQGFIKALEKLISDSQLRLSMGAAGRAKIADYSLHNVLAQMEQIYDRFAD